MKTNVVHCKQKKFDIYIGRPKASKKKGNEHFGNPFSHVENSYAEIKVNTRKEAVKCFESWLLGNSYIDVLQNQRKYIIEQLSFIKGKTLGCWCKPNACHGDVLAKFADKYF